MNLRLVVCALTAAASGYGAMRVNQIVQIPAQPQQTMTAVTTDAQGNLIATGHNGQGAFLYKLDMAGNVVFTYSVQGPFASGVTADAKGDVYWIGAAGTPTFPFPFTRNVLTAPAFDGALPGFVVKFHGQDGSIAWATGLGALQPATITVDAIGQATVAGVANASPGLTAGGGYQSPSIGTALPVEIVRLSANGDAIFAATYGGHTINSSDPVTCQPSPWFLCLASPRMQAGGVLLDAQGHIWIAGTTNMIDLPLTATALQKKCGCSRNSGDGFLAEFSADGSQLMYATYLGTSTASENDTAGDDSIASAALGSGGRIWVAGKTNGSDLPVTADAAQAKRAGDVDGFVMGFDPAVNRIAYATYYGTRRTNGITHIAVGPDGVPVFAGHLDSSPDDWFNSGHDFAASLGASGIQAASLQRQAAGTGLAFTPSGSFVVAGSANVATVLGSATDNSPSIFAVTNSATLTASGQVSPGEIISLFGTNLGPSIPMTAGGLPTQVGGVQVLVDGVAAPLLYLSSSQINAVVPFGVKKTIQLAVSRSGVSSNAALLGVAPATPGVFTTQSEYQGYPVAAVLNQDGTINSQTNRAVPGTIVSVFATGLGALSPQPADGIAISTTPLPALQQKVLVASGAEFLDVLYAGPAPGMVAGAMQVNFRLPTSVTATPPIVMFVENWITPYFTVWVSGT